MKTTYFYTFLPTKAEEEEEKRFDNPKKKVKRVLVQIREFSPPLILYDFIDPMNPIMVPKTRDFLSSLEV